jgi:hypothetical protein
VCHWDSVAAALHIKMLRGCEENANAAREIQKSDTRATRVRELGGWVGVGVLLLFVRASVSLRFCFTPLFWANYFETWHAVSLKRTSTKGWDFKSFFFQK